MTASDAAAEAYLRARRLSGEDATSSSSAASPYLRPEITQAVDQEVAAWLQASLLCTFLSGLSFV